MGNGSGNRPSSVAPPTHGDITIYLAQEPVEFRLGINGLSTMVEAKLKFGPFSRNGTGVAAALTGWLRFTDDIGTHCVS